MTRVLAVFACLVAAISGVQAQQSFRDRTGRWGIGLNVGVLPTLDVGYAINDGTSLHMKGTYVPNIFGESELITGWMAMPAVRFWQADPFDNKEPFMGMYIEFGIPYVSFNLFSDALFGSEDGDAGRRGCSIGGALGVGYAFKVSEHLRLTPNITIAALVLPQMEYYKRVTDGDGTMNTVRMPTPKMPGFILPLEAGLKLEFVF